MPHLLPRQPASLLSLPPSLFSTYHRNLGLMPAFAEKSDSLGAKLVTFYSQQAEGVPSHQAIVVVLDPQTGSLQAVCSEQCLSLSRGGATHPRREFSFSLLQIVDGVMVTNMRTAAVSACAVRVSVSCTQHTLTLSTPHSHSPPHTHTLHPTLTLPMVTLCALPPPPPPMIHTHTLHPPSGCVCYPHSSSLQALVPHPPSVLCIVGTGVQARSHAEALTVHHTFSEVLYVPVLYESCEL